MSNSARDTILKELEKRKEIHRTSKVTAELDRRLAEREKKQQEKQRQADIARGFIAMSEMTGGGVNGQRVSAPTADTEKSYSPLMVKAGQSSGIDFSSRDKAADDAAFGAAVSKIRGELDAEAKAKEEKEAAEREAIINYDTEAGKKKIEQYEDNLSDLYERQNEVDEKIASYGGTAIYDGIIEVGRTDVDERKALLNEKISMKLKDTEKGISDKLNDERAMLKAANKSLDRFEHQATSAPDFADKSGYVSTKYDPVADKHDYLYNNEFSMGYGDLTYEYINNQNGVRDEILGHVNDGGRAYSDFGYEYMTPEQVSIYNYYYATEGREKAEQYLSLIADDLTTALAGERVKAFDDTWKEPFYNFDAGMRDFGTNMTKGVYNFFTGSEDGIVRSADSKAAELARQNNEGFSGVVNDLAYTTGNMLPSIGASALANVVAPGSGAFVGNTLMGVSSAAAGYDEMIKLGYNPSQAQAYGILTGTSEAVIQYIMGGIGALGGGVIDDLIPGVNKAIAKLAIKHPNLAIFANVGKEMGKEALEEGLQSVLEPVFKAYATGEDFEGVDVSEVLYSALLGALSSGVLEGAPTIAVNTPGMVSNVIVGAANKQAAKGQIIKGIDNATLTKDMSRLAVDALKSGVDAVGKDSAADYAADFRSAYHAGRLGMPLGAVADSAVMSYSQRQAAYNLGMEDGKASKSQTDGDLSAELAKDPEIAAVIKAIEAENAAQSGVRSTAGRALDTQANTPKVRAKEFLTKNGALSSEQEVNAKKAESAKTDTARTGYLSGASEMDIHIAESMAKLTGREILFAGEGYEADGEFDGNNTIIVNPKRGSVLSQIIAHELTHSIQGTEEYTSLVNNLKDFVNTYSERGMIADWDTLYSEVWKDYEQKHEELTGEKFDDAKAEKEIVARVMETFFGEGESTSERQVDLTNFIMEFTAANKNAATRIWYKLTQMAKRIREDIAHYATKKVWGENYDNSYREHQLMLRKIEDLRDQFGRALMEAKGKPGDGKRALALANKNNRGEYNAFREFMAKEALDNLSVKLGAEFPLSANFDKTMRANNTPLVMTTVNKGSVAISRNSDLFVQGRNAFISKYGKSVNVNIKQMGISAKLPYKIVGESLSKDVNRQNKQLYMDLIPNIAPILENSILLGIERTAHTDNKGAVLFEYRLYNLYYYSEKTLDPNTNKTIVTKTPRCLVCTVSQYAESATGWVFRDIKNVTTGQVNLVGNNTNASLTSSHGNNYSIAQLYDFVKRVKREDGGLKYNSSEKLNYLFNYTERNDGTQYSLSKSNTTPQNELETKMKAQALSMYADMRKAQRAQKATDITEESIYEQTGWGFDDYGNFVIDREAPVYLEDNTVDAMAKASLVDILKAGTTNPVVKSKIDEWATDYEKMNAEADKLRSLKAQQKELYFKKGKRDMAKINAIREEVTKTQNRIAIYDKKILNIEGMEPIKRLLEAEGSKTFKEAMAKATEKAKEADARWRERKLVQINRERILRLANRIDKLYTKPTKERNIKEEERILAGQATELARVVFAEKVEKRDAASLEFPYATEKELVELSRYRELLARREEIEREIAGEMEEKTGDTANRVNDVWRPVGNAMENGIPTDSIPQNPGAVNFYGRNKMLKDSDLEAYMQTGKTLHTRNKKARMLETGKNPILKTFAEIKQFISDAISGKAIGEVRACGIVGSNLATAIRDVNSSLDVEGRYIELNADDIRESYKRHSQPKEKGDIPLSDDDFKKIPEYLDDFDGVLSVDKYNDKIEIHLYKALSDGYVRILTVSSKERNSLIVSKLIGVSKEKFETKYSKKIERYAGSPRGQNASNPPTEARRTAGDLSNNSIPQNPEAVKMQGETSINSEGAELEAIDRDIASLEDLLDPLFDRKMAELRSIKASDIIGELADSYGALARSEVGYIQAAYDEEAHAYLEGLKGDERLDGKTAKDMTSEELETVYNAFSVVANAIYRSNRLFNEGKTVGVSESSHTVISQVGNAFKKQKSDNAVLRTMGELIKWDNLKPETAIELLGSEELLRLYREMQDGELVYAADMNEATDYKDLCVEKYDADKWDRTKLYTFTTNDGIPLELTLGQMMSVYALSKRLQADEHLKIGGIVPKKIVNKLWNEHKSEIKKSLKDGKAEGADELLKIIRGEATTYKVSDELISGITSKLTDKQKSFCDDMQKYLSEEMAAKGNEVSMKLYGIELFKEKAYFPLVSAPQYMVRNYEAQKGEKKIKNKGFTHNTVDHARNPVVIDDFMDVWAGHVNEMSQYHGLTTAIEDFTKVYGYIEGAEEKFDAVSVRAQIENVHGTNATKYIDTFLTQLNGGVRRESANAYEKLVSLSKKNAVLASLSVVVQQPTAGIRAMVYTGFHPYGKIDRAEGMRLWEELKHYAPIAVIKEMGRFDTGMSRSAAAQLAGPKTRLDKVTNTVDNVMGFGAEWADKLTWCAIWKTCQRKVYADNKSLKLGTEANKQAAGKLFTEVIRKTQVYDSVFSRTQAMRSKNPFHVFSTAFMSEPMTIVDMVVHAAHTGDKKLIARTMAAVTLSHIVNSAVKSVVYAMRDDDENETYLEKYLQALTSSVLEGFNLLTYIPFAKDMWSLIEGYDVERTDMALIGDLIDAVKSWGNDNKSLDRKLIDTIGAVASFTGIPVNNLARDVYGIANFFTTLTSGIPDTGLGTWQAFWSSVQESVLLKADTKSDVLYQAAIGDKAHLARLRTTYKTAEAYETALKKALREHDPRVREAATALADGDIDAYTDIIEDIIGEGNFSKKHIVSATRTEYDNILDERNTQEDVEDVDWWEDYEEDDSEEAYSLYSASDIGTALDSGDSKLAKEIIADLIDTKVRNGADEKKARSSVKSGVTSYYKELYLAAYDSGNYREKNRILDALLQSGLYGKNRTEVKETLASWEKAHKEK